jgi:hypothetical protein
MIVTETVLDVEFRKCSPVLTHPRSSAEERTFLAVLDPGLKPVGARPSRRDTAAWWRAGAFVQRVDVAPVPDVAEELICVRHCIEPPPADGAAALAAGAAARVPATAAAATPAAAAPRNRLMVMVMANPPSGW